MHLNFLCIPMLLMGGLLLLGGFKVSLRARPALFVLAVLLGIPALLFAVYYVHVLDRAAWFYQFRAVPWSELSASGLGLGIGLILGRLWSPTAGKARLFAPIVVLVGVSIWVVPYIKPVLAPLQIPLKSQWAGEVALQSTPSTCGPCSAITLLKKFHIAASESELARECFTYRGGTENWYVARALRRRGLKTHYLMTSAQPKNMPVDSIAGVQLGGPGVGGHFITILGRSGDKTIVGDPLVGKLTLSSDQLHARYYFTGFFLVALRADV